MNNNERASAHVEPRSQQRIDVRDNTGMQSESGSQLALPLSTGIPVMRAAEASEVNEDNQVSDAEGAAPIELYDRADASLGQRFCAAREAHGWTRADVAARLKLPAQLIARLEGDDYAGLTAGVFLRGYLSSYARLVGVPVEEADRVAAAHTQTVPLISTGTISRSRYLFERYSVSATYLILTAIIVVPAVWLATHGGLEQNLARTTLLDPPAQITTTLPAREATVPAVDTQVVATEPATSATSPLDVSAAPPIVLVQVDQPPIISSMAPFPSAPNPTPQPMPASASNPSAAAIGSGAHTLNLKLTQQSWVEVTAADGRKLEYGMLVAGSEHNYRSDGPISVRLGNTQAAEVRTDGTIVDLTPYERGNVAHVKVFGSAGSGVSRIDQ